NKDGVITGIDLSTQSAMVTSILIDLAQRETKNLSARFASILTDQLAERTLVLPDSHRFAGFVVLKALDVPSVLIEMGYLSNADDEAALASKRHRRIVAKAIRDAIDGYFQWQRSSHQSWAPQSQPGRDVVPPQIYRYNRGMTFLRGILGLLSNAGLFGIVALLLAVNRFSAELPDYQALADYPPPLVTRVLAGD